MGAGPPAWRPPRLEELHRAADRGRRARPRRAGHPLLRGRHPLAVRGTDPRRHGLHGRRQHVRWVPGLEGRRLRLRDAGRPERGAEAALQPPPADPRGRLVRPEAPARVEGAAHRGRRARQPRGALSRRRRRRDDRSGRLRRRRRQQPAASDRAHDRPRGRAQGRNRHASRSTPSTRTSMSSSTRRC